MRAGELEYFITTGMIKGKRDTRQTKGQDDRWTEEVAQRKNTSPVNNLTSEQRTLQRLPAWQWTDRYILSLTATDVRN